MSAPKIAVDPVTASELQALGLDAAEAKRVSERFSALASTHAPDQVWRALTQELLTPAQPFAVHELVFARLAAAWDEARGPFPAWLPERTGATNLERVLAERGLPDVPALHARSVADRAGFWGDVIERLGIVFAERPSAVLDASDGPERPRWLPGARLNAAQSCFQAAPDTPAIVFQREGRGLERWTVAELEALSGRVANGLRRAGFAPGDALAVNMPMTPESVAIYLGAVRAGCAIVSIADSFTPAEIATRLRIGAAKGIFTQDVILRGGKTLPLFERVREAAGPRAIVLPAAERLQVELRPGDLPWADLLAAETAHQDHVGAPDDVTNVLFSSGTTGDPKAIPWTHTTPIKAAADGHLHHDIRPGDVVAWPTNLGWMMGPWLIYAALVNQATIALYEGAPTGAGFARFVQDAGVTMLGVVPSLVATWRASGCTDGVDWSGVRAFSSTGECSNASDMLWLMSRAGYKPVIEYCGGTEIGGGYLTGSVLQPAAPSTFSTPAFGLDLVLLDEEGRPARAGEVFLVPPSIGLSTRLLNRDHHEVYYAHVPPDAEGRLLRRHGDQLEALPGGYYRAHGRVDDTMNLGGIKVSSAEIEQVLNAVEGVQQTAAIAVSPPGGGPSRLVVYVERTPGAALEQGALQAEFQRRIREHLNPLFKVAEVVLTERLPRTASNKVMRRELRAQHQAAAAS